MLIAGEKNTGVSYYLDKNFQHMQHEFNKY
jgi:hypothetical protein